MNTTISRIAAAAPVAVALLGFGIGSANAAPYDPASADKVQMQPADEPPSWDVDFPISDDLPDGDPPVDPEDVGPAEPADEPADEPAEDDSDGEESPEESDEDADNGTEGSNNGGGSSNGGFQGGSNGVGETADQDEVGDEAEQAPVEAADVPVTPVSAAGVQVPAELVASAGVALAGVVGWAAYRRTKAIATA